MTDERISRIRDRAHAIWEEAGRPEGQDTEHWAQAEREIAAMDEAQVSASAETAGGRRGRKPKVTSDEAADAPKARRGRSRGATADTSAEASAETPGSTRGRKTKAVTDEGGEVPKAARGRKPKAASGGVPVASTEANVQEPQAAAAAEGAVAPKAKRGRKPKIAAEGSDTVE
ncbi:MAG: DUF2934 domain-containing protein [Alphaproteobacteria bacterium]|nr:DUF2934 domain-containing protein [Alphaproteobacteria bacterium]